MSSLRKPITPRSVIDSETSIRVLYTWKVIKGLYTIYDYSIMIKYTYLIEYMNK